MNDQIFKTITKYPVDDIPLDKNERIKPSNLGLDYIRGDSLVDLLKSELSGYRILMKGIESLSVTEDETKSTLYFIANTGFDFNHYIPCGRILDMIRYCPEIVVTDLDKALLNLIHEAAVLTIGISDESDDRCILNSFIYFFHNAQNYERKMKVTVELNDNMDNDFIFNVLTDPDYSFIHDNSIKLTEQEEQRLNEVISYREDLEKAIVEDRLKEKAYAQNENNNAYWELFISWLNNRWNNEKRLLNLIHSNDDPNVKFNEFEVFLDELRDSSNKVLNTETTISELEKAVFERIAHAVNYVYFENDEGKVSLLENEYINAFMSSCTFNYLLIAYHAFLLNPTPNVISHLTFLLNDFISKNLGNTDYSKNEKHRLRSLDENLIETCNQIFLFYEEHKDTVNSLKFDHVQEDETLSGLGFDDDVKELVINRKEEMAKQLYDELGKIDPEKREELSKKCKELLSLDETGEKYEELKETFHVFLPNVKLENEEILFDQETAKRLIVSINAIYILFNTIEKLIELNYIKEERKAELNNARKRLTYLERSLVINTYINPDYSVFENADIEEYRLRKGIDASIIIDKNKELRVITLCNIAKKNIKRIHEQINSINGIVDASQIKKDLRDELKNNPDDYLKEFVIELVDQESEYLSEWLVKRNSTTAEFSISRHEVCDYIGPSYAILPERTINSLATAEMLFDKYSTLEYSSTDFDYSCISVLYYQAVESMYNDLLWSKYASMLNALDYNGDWFSYLYRFEKLPTELLGYLPKDSQSKFLNKEKRGIAIAIPMGNFNYLFFNATGNSTNALPHFKAYIDTTFGFDNISKASEEYKAFQNRIDELYKQFAIAIPLRNAASHGQNAISLEECKYDRKLVLSDVENIRNNSLGLVLLFLSLFRTN